MDHRPGLQVTYFRTVETTEHGPVPGGDYKTRWQATAMACCPWSRLKKVMEKTTVKPSKCLTTVVWRGTQKLEKPCFGIEFQTSYLIRQTGCSCAHKQVMCKHTYLLFTSVSFVDTNEMSVSIHVWITPICQRQQWAVGFPWWQPRLFSLTLWKIVAWLWVIGWF